jgi:hypothetical protein
MRAITIEAKSVGSARGLYNALIDFHPELAESENDRHCVSVEFGTSGTRLCRCPERDRAVRHRGEQGPVRIDVDGRRHTLHAVPSQS